MTDDLFPNECEKYTGCPCGIFTVNISFSPKMRKIKHVLPNMNFNPEVAEAKLCCSGWINFFSYWFSEVEIAKNSLIEIRDKLQKAGINHNCGEKWFEKGRSFNGCLDMIFDALEKHIPVGADKEPKPKPI